MCAAVLASGFDHVSDDDFARVTIAQRFAVSPRLDPSGTSWLPFPFWALGTALAIFGRSLEAARVASVVLASAAAALPYVAMRQVGAERRPALAATALALLSPWSLWLGAATTPESMTASATAAAAVAFGGGLGAHALAPWAAVLGCACLSRYETWPVAALVAIASLARAVRSRDRALGVVALACVLGPLAWMAWNAHAHDGPLHFFRRVAGYKRAIGEGTTDTLAALVAYPKALVTTRPDVSLGAALAIVLLRGRDEGRRWLLPAACVLAQLAFLAIGNARDGAPTHHPERALLASMVVLALLSADALASTLTTDRARAAVAGSLVAAAWLFAARPLFEAPPGSGAHDDRRAQLARGRELTRAGARALVVTPCAYEHFALLAAYGAPERAEVRDKTGAPPSPLCPSVELR